MKLCCSRPLPLVCGVCERVRGLLLTLASIRVSILFIYFFSIFNFSFRFRFQIMHIKVLLDEPHLCIHFSELIECRRWTLTKKRKWRRRRRKKNEREKKRIEPDALVKIFPSQRFETFVREMLFWRTLKLRRIKNRSKNMQLKFQWNMLLIGSKRALSSFVNKVLHQTQWAREWESERSTLNISPIKWKPSLCIQCQFSLPSCSLFNII